MKLVTLSLLFVFSLSAFANSRNQVVELVKTNDDQFTIYNCEVKNANDQCEAVGIIVIQDANNIPPELRVVFEKTRNTRVTSLMEFHGLGSRCSEYLSYEANCYLAGFMIFDGGAAMLGFGKASASFDVIRGFVGMFDILKLNGRYWNKDKKGSVLILSSIEDMLQLGLDKSKVTIPKSLVELFKDSGSL